LAIFPLIISVIHGNTADYRGGYAYTGVTFVIVSLISVILSILIFLNNKKKNILGKSTKVAKAKGSFRFWNNKCKYIYLSIKYLLLN